MSGDGKISLSLGGAKKAKFTPTNGVKRSHAALRDGDEEENTTGQAQTVSHFDRAAGGAIDEDHRPKKEAALVIAPQANRDWREASQRNKRQRVPLELQQSSRAAEIEAHDQSKKPTVGLNIRKKEDAEAPNGDVKTVAREEDVQPEPADAAPVQPKTDDELAMDALLGNKKKSDLVLPAITEDEAFERDIHSAPDMSTLDDYARVPVEQFGAALLRGMGWKEGEGIGSQRGQKVVKTKVPERRPALLGIGAKEEAAVKEEMGAWGRAARGGKGKGGEPKVYNPILLRDKRTGEMFTEEEAEKRKQKAEQDKYEMEFERKEQEKAKRRRDDSRDHGDDRREKDRRKDDRHRERRRDDDEDDYRKEKERRRRKDKEQNGQESDDERARRKEKERRRRDRESDYRDSNRDRSRRHDEDRDRNRDRRR